MQGDMYIFLRNFYIFLVIDRGKNDVLNDAKTLILTAKNKKIA